MDEHPAGSDGSVYERLAVPQGDARLDPAEGTAESLGAPLTEEDQQALRSVDWSNLPDEQLTERVSKVLRGF